MCCELPNLFHSVNTCRMRTNCAKIVEVLFQCVSFQFVWNNFWESLGKVSTKLTGAIDFCSIGNGGTSLRYVVKRLFWHSVYLYSSFFWWCWNENLVWTFHRSTIQQNWMARLRVRTDELSMFSLKISVNLNPVYVRREPRSIFLLASEFCVCTVSGFFRPIFRRINKWQIVW